MPTPPPARSAACRGQCSNAIVTSRYRPQSFDLEKSLFSGPPRVRQNPNLVAQRPESIAPFEFLE